MRLGRFFPNIRHWFLMGCKSAWWVQLIFYQGKFGFCSTMLTLQTLRPVHKAATRPNSGHLVLGRGRLLGVLSLAHGLPALRLAHLGLLVHLGHDVLEGGPTMAHWNFWAILILFLVTSSSRPFLCFLRKRTVQQMFLGFLWSMCALWVRELTNL